MPEVLAKPPLLLVISDADTDAVEAASAAAPRPLESDSARLEGVCGMAHSLCWPLGKVKMAGDPGVI